MRQLLLSMCFSLIKCQSSILFKSENKPMPFIKGLVHEKYDKNKLTLEPSELNSRHMNSLYISLTTKYFSWKTEFKSLIRILAKIEEWF